MTTNNLKGKYFVRKDENSSWEDITTKFSGVKVLSASGFNELGETTNVYCEQWVNSQREDFHVAGDSVIRKNADLRLTFICGERYGASDTQATHDDFVEYMCNQGDLYLKSEYVGKYAHVVCTKAYKPTTEKLHRGKDSYIMGTIELHILDKVMS